MQNPLTMHWIHQRLLFEESRDQSTRFNLRIFLLFLVHIPLAFAIRESQVAATVHALAVFSVGMHVATRRNSADKLSYVVAYIAGAELLWRLGHAYVFWEFGKYSASAVMLVYLLTHRFSTRGLGWPAVYFALLIPSCFISWDRQLISSHVSGPFALAVTTFFFSQMRLRLPQIRRLFLAFLAPAMALTLLSTYSTATAGVSLAFGGVVSKLTSAGMGPNQMSSILGLGLFLGFLYLFTQPGNYPMKLGLLALMVWMAGQAAMTYSRGGLWSGLIAICIASFFLLRRRRLRFFLVAGFLLFAALAQYVLIPTLERFSDYTLVARFKSLDSSGRDERAWADVEAFLENPLFGVGPGRPRPGDFEMSAHTELTRLPAEHGILGLIALGLLLSMAARRLNKGPSLYAAAFATSLTAWALMTMVHSAMRLYAPAFAFGLAEAVLLLRPMALEARRRVSSSWPAPTHPRSPPLTAHSAGFRDRLGPGTPRSAVKPRSSRAAPHAADSG